MGKCGRHLPGVLSSGKAVPCGKRKITKILRSLGLCCENLQQNCSLLPEASGFRMCCVSAVTLGQCPPQIQPRGPSSAGCRDSAQQITLKLQADGRNAPSRGFWVRNLGQRLPASSPAPLALPRRRWAPARQPPSGFRLASVPPNARAPTE